MYNSASNYLIRKSNMQNVIESKHKIGQLYFLGINIHQFFEISFYMDHDFNVVENKITGEIIIIDPSVSDYLWVKRVSGVN
ncbi:MAG: hypothetical protein ACI86M_003118 [Saprospiraceae bacterium]|jgi:hypothetical protein